MEHRAYFQIGGTLPPDARSYIARHADEELFAALRQGQFCYVLDASQVGKSSLMLRTAARLQEAGVRVAILDLARVGQNVTPESWYETLLLQLADQLCLAEEVEAFWDAQAPPALLPRWMEAVRQVILPGLTAPLVIFIDEIGIVQNVPFSADEFFAGIRECYTRRAQDPSLARLTFCLLGTATPDSLIRDVRTTPFNIGTRVELTDFTEAEAEPLARGLAERGLEEPYAVVRRILHWTGGHPYLTQRLCLAVAERPKLASWGGVNRLCGELFLTPGARASDDNLRFVGSRLLREGEGERGEEELSNLLALVERLTVRRRSIPDDAANPLHGALRLSGLARVEGGRLRVRNRIYERVFGREWIREKMPGAELRRQRVAFRKGLWRSLAVCGIILAVVGRLAINQYWLAVEKGVALDEVRSEHEKLQRLLYVADMNVAQQAQEAGSLERARQLLDEHRPKPGEADLRGFEWFYRWRRCRGDERYTLRGHDGIVHCVAFSHDGKRLASGGMDKKIRLWAVERGREKLAAVLAGHKDRIAALAFSPDGKTLASAGWDKAIRLWDVTGPGGEAFAVLEGHTDRVYGVAFSPSGRTLASASWDGTVRLWDVKTRREKARSGPPGRADRIACLAFSPDGKRVATGSYDKSIGLWDAATLKQEAVLHGHNGSVWSVAFSPEGKILASGGEDETVRLWDVPSWRFLAALHGHLNQVTSLAFSSDGRTLASGSSDNTIRTWDIVARQTKITLIGHTNEVMALALSPDGRSLATGSKDETVKLWDLTTRREQDTIPAHRKEVTTLAFSPDGRLLATGSADMTARLWDAASHALLATLHAHGDSVTSVAFSPDGRTLVTGSKDRTARLWNVAPRSHAVTPAGALKAHTRAILTVAFSPDGKTLATGGEDNTVILWEVASARMKRVLRGHQHWIHCVAFSADGRLLATGSRDRTIKMWDAASGKEIARLPGHKDVVSSVAYSPDGRKLVSSSGYGDIKVWDIASSREVSQPFSTHIGNIYSGIFSADGKTLATGGLDKTVKLWNTDRWRLVQTLQTGSSRIRCMAFSPNDRELVTGGGDGTVRFFRAAVETEVAALERGGRWGQALSQEVR